MYRVHFFSSIIKQYVKLEKNKRKKIVLNMLHTHTRAHTVAFLEIWRERFGFCAGVKFYRCTRNHEKRKKAHITCPERTLKIVRLKFHMRVLVVEFFVVVIIETPWVYMCNLFETNGIIAIVLTIARGGVVAAQCI